VSFDTAQYVRDLGWLLPELWLTLAGFVLLALAPFARDAAARRRLAWLSAVAQGITLVLMVPLLLRDGVFGAAGPDAPGAVFRVAGGQPLLVIDGFALLFGGLVVLAGLLSTLMGIRFLEIEKLDRGEFHAVLLFAVLGGMFLVASTDFISLFVGLETMSLSVYLLVGWARDDRKSNEGALKYFLLGALASGFLLYGMSLVYGATGSTNLFGIAAAIGDLAAGHAGPFLLVGLLLLVVGVGFKMAAVPFHMWTPDAYEGAPTLVTAFMSTAVKTAAFGFGLRLFLVGFPAAGMAREWTLLFALLAALSMTLGNWVALLQDNIKRLLAYSSIAHAGYMLLGLVAVGAVLAGEIPAGLRSTVLEWGQVSVILYAIAYTFTNLGAFALVVMMRRGRIAGDRVDDFSGLARRRPLYAAIMTIFLLSLGGIPATAGFVGKYWLFSAILEAGYGWLALVAVVNSAVSLYYYLRIVVRMYMAPPVVEEPYAVTPALAATVAIALAGVLVLGLLPQPFLDLVAGTLLLGP